MDQLTKSLNSDLIGNFNGLPDVLPVRRTLKKMKSFSIPVLFKSNLIGKIKEASKFGHTEIDDFLRFKKNEFIVVSGHANVGKTHTIMYLMLLHTLRNDTKWMVFSSENEVGSLQRKLIEFKLGKIR